MIPFDFEYYRPDTVEEAVNLFNHLNGLGKKPIYYGGGSEIISMARVNNLYTEAVIDIKGIQACNEYALEGEELKIGAALTLSKIARENLFPLLTMAVKRIADHTMQGKITIGGNICGTIIYKEAILPLLVSNSEIIIASQEGQRKEFLMDIFYKKIKLKPGEMIVKFIIAKKHLNLPHYHIKRTKNEKIDYPLISMVAIKNRDDVNIAFSGLGDYPFRSNGFENILNDTIPSKKDKIQKAIKSIENKIRSDGNGSKEYKKFMLTHVLDNTLKDLQEEN